MPIAYMHTPGYGVHRTIGIHTFTYSADGLIEANIVLAYSFVYLALTH